LTLPLTLTEVRGFGFAEINKLAPELSMEGEAFRLNMILKILKILKDLKDFKDFDFLHNTDIFYIEPINALITIIITI